MRPRHGTARWPVRGIAALVPLALLTAACAAEDADDERVAVEEATEDVAVDTPDEAAMDTDAAGPDDAAAPIPPGGEDFRGRHVVRTAHLQLEVRDSAAAADEVTRIADDAGGYVATTDLQRRADGVVSGRLTLRVPAELLDDVVDDLDGLAESVPERRIDETDVTGEVTDLEAELANLTAFEEQLRDLLADVRADDGGAEDLVTVFERINEVRSRIDRLEARRSVLADQVALATVHVTLRPTASAQPVTATEWNPAETFHGAVAATTRALAAVADGAIRFVVTVLPVAVVVLAPVGLLGWGVRAGVRRRRRTRTRYVPGPDDGRPTDAAT